MEETTYWQDGSASTQPREGTCLDMAQRLRDCSVNIAASQFKLGPSLGDGILPNVEPAGDGEGIETSIASPLHKNTCVHG